MDITVTHEGQLLVVTTPYSGTWNTRANELKGEWSRERGARIFSCVHEALIRQALVNIFGTDGTGPSAEPRLARIDVAMIMAVRSNYRQAECVIAGRTVAKRRGRDMGATLGEGVILAEGGFAGCGGSMKYPELSPKSTCVVHMEMPAGALAMALERYGDAIQDITPEPEPELDVDEHIAPIVIVTEADDTTAATPAPAEELLARLARVEQALGAQQERIATLEAAVGAQQERIATLEGELAQERAQAATQVQAAAEPEKPEEEINAAQAAEIFGVTASTVRRSLAKPGAPRVRGYRHGARVYALIEMRDHWEATHPVARI